MRWHFTFGLASDDLFFVASRRVIANSHGTSPRSKLTTFPNENDFLKLLVAADVGLQQTVQLSAAVLNSIVRPKTPPAWVDADLTQHQMRAMHLYGLQDSDPDTVPSETNDLYLNAARSGSLPQFYDLLMQAPTAIAMVIGPEHRFTFLNNRYAALIGTKSPAGLLGRTVIESFPELVAQKVIQKFDRAYQTGVGYSENEFAYKYHHEVLGRTEERYLTTNCHPITDAFGEVAGLMLQATDVTEIVLARSVREHREKLLYRQWSELEAIYRSAALSVLIIDARDWRILKVNQTTAEIFGETVSALVGKPVMDFIHFPERIAEIYRRVAAGETVQNQLFERESAASPGVARCWVGNFAPLLSASGEVDAITFVGIQISDEVRETFQSLTCANLASTP